MIGSLSAIVTIALPLVGFTETWEARSPDTAPSATVKLSASSESKSWLVGITMVCVAPAGESAGKVMTAPGGWT